MKDQMDELVNESTKYKHIILNQRQLCDLELLLNGGFYPLNGFLYEKDYLGVIENCRLANGKLWPMPIVLSIHDDKVQDLKDSRHITLKDEQNFPLAILRDIELYKPNLINECIKVYGTDDTNHPYVKIIMSNPNVHYIGGVLDRIQLPKHYDYTINRLTPYETKQLFVKNNWNTIVGFQTRNPMHRSHLELTMYALKEAGNDAKLLLQPVIGITQDCDVDYHTRVRCYKKLLKYYPQNTVELALLPLSMRMAGPREALWHALIRANYGCTHFIIGRDHAGPSYKDKNGNNFYKPYDAQYFVEKYKDELPIKILTSKMISYVKELNKYLPENEVPEGMTILNISGTQQRDMLTKRMEIPEWFSYPDIVEELRNEYISINKMGFCVYFVGLSGSGKSTLTSALESRLREINPYRRITILDADTIRQNLSKGLGFSKEDRSTNVQRIGYVAHEIVKHRGICLVANIAPYQSDRQKNRNLISQYGKYIQVYVKTELEICEQRDCKGLYRLARQGIIKEFTGISDPFEEPNESEIIVNGNDNIELNIEVIINKLKELQLLDN
ncbi:bifunctional sulfate adenylyltransferase/adenylylsulfate kinase [Fadolivirus algeromassiliense]|jgi:sulfate adenylyltransferase|uniref:Bifunctional sulfate adenylyltransferase/adenylylsulfate kinase n=1 Tax=Fadolivirus FV1/VV64 TaxID=3070911 RepID=A0A7D3UUE8_9VIRU|nr:bifunctional sulfate adenylyltransferase/adenylylsulfate kinase [Fadolivirus algeromassiliense]QKF94091.1 bifunctional sulfate adenylyltransferase/adenylylsulfate kinase [Fadolivirus FV1/VV64]